MADSLIGYIDGTISDPSPLTDSLIGYSVGAISGVFRPSTIGYVTGTILDPHKPIGKFTGTDIVYLPILKWDGDSLR